MNLIYQINPHILHENLEGEVIVINLNTGMYFSMNAVGGHIWSMIGKNYTQELILQTLARMCQETIAAIEVPVNNFLTSLEDNTLITKIIGDSLAEADDFASYQLLFAAPALEIYQDMQEMLLLDPIHDVDETTGWPHLKEETNC